MTPLRVEEASFNAWPALQSLLYDGWLLRFANGYTKRANSINPIFRGSLTLDKKIEYCEMLYGRETLQPIFRLTTIAEIQELDKSLAAKNYGIIDRTKVQILDLTSAPPTTPSYTVILTNHGGLRSWLDVFHMLNPHRVDDLTHEKMLRTIIGPVAPMIMTVNDEIVACGLGVVEDDYLGLFDIVTGADHRRKGYAQELTRSLMSWGRGLGAKYAYLQVMESNKAAVELYQKLGFRDLYHYWYRVLP